MPLKDLPVDAQPREKLLARGPAALSDAERRKLALDVARDLRRENVATMRAQQSPDGEAWAPRKRGLRDQKGQIRKGLLAQDMFTKLRGARYLKAKAQGRDATVEFMGRAARIAAVHHFGLRDKIRGKTVQYPERQLIGITDADIDRIEDALLKHLTASL